MKAISNVVILAIFPAAFSSPPDFLAEQKQFPKVRAAIEKKQSMLESTLAANGLETGNLNILIIAYKDEDELEIYAKKKTENTYRKLTSYRICSRSGQLEPKRKEGDCPVPEGFYHINMFNPSSNFFLSLGINYPNLSDQRKSTAAHLGGSIFTHGACVTIGCLPMTNDGIMEIYLYAVHARNSGQTNIPVYIFPFRMTDGNFREYKAKFRDDPGLIDFSSNLKTGYDKFVSEKKQLGVIVDAHGDYGFKP